MAPFTTGIRKRLGSAIDAAYRAWTGADGLLMPRTNVKPVEAQGVSATPSYGGYLVSRETQPELIGLQRFQTFDEMLFNTSIIAASARYYQNMISRPGWEFDPVDDTDTARMYADLTDEALRGYLDTPWHSVIKKMSTYRLYGYSLQEWVMRLEPEMSGPDGRPSFVFSDVQNRLQRTIGRWDVDRQGKIKGVVQRSPHDGHDYYLPRGKLVYLVDDAFDDSPEGVGLFRHVVQANKILDRLQQLEVWGYETDLKGMPVVRAPLSYLQNLVDEGKMTPAEMEEVLSPLKEILEKHVRTPDLGLMLDSIVYEGRGGDVITPSVMKMFDFDIVKGEVTANAQQAANEAIQRYVWDIARVFGTETLLLGANGRGAYALAKDKTQNLLMVVDGVLADCVAAVKRDMIVPLFTMNNWPKKYMPTPVTDAVQYRDLESISKMVLDLAKSGAVLSPDDPLITTLRRAAGLPRPPEVNRAAEAQIAIDEAQADAIKNPPKPPTGSGDQKKPAKKEAP